jgi:hypothetical protein
VRKDTNKYFVYKISNVSFSQLVHPTTGIPRTVKPCKLPSDTIKTLAETCRIAIRAQIRRNLFNTHPIKMQFEIGLTKEADDQENEENQMERIGTFYFADRRNRELGDQPERANQGICFFGHSLYLHFDILGARNEQQPEQNEEMFDQPEPANRDAETPEEIRNLLRTPPLPEQQNLHNEEPNEIGPEQARDNLEALDQEDVPIPVQNIPMEDGVDAETAALAQARIDNNQNDNDGHQPEPAEERREQVSLLPMN